MYYNLDLSFYKKNTDKTNVYYFFFLNDNDIDNIYPI